MNEKTEPQRESKLFTGTQYREVSAKILPPGKEGLWTYNNDTGKCEYKEMPSVDMMMTLPEGTEIKIASGKRANFFFYAVKDGKFTHEWIRGAWEEIKPVSRKP